MINVRGVARNLPKERQKTGSGAAETRGRVGSGRRNPEAADKC